MNKKTIKDLNIDGKKVLVRVDFNVPMKNGEITNDNRIQAALPTIKHIIDNNGKAILFSHLGKVKTEEDKEGKPFIGKAGKLLTKIFEAAGIDRKEVYITNVVKCRPPDNRTPVIEEMLACSKYLETQIALINPDIIVCLGSTPTKWFLKSTEGITKLRGKWFKWRGIDLMPMFHPSYLLRNQSRKPGSPKEVTWKDIQEIKRYLDVCRNRKDGS